MGFRFEFDPANKILLTRIEGQFTDELLRACEVESRKHAAATGPLVHIVECTGITEYAVSSDLVRHMAKQTPILTGPGTRQFFIAPTAVGFGLARMFQIAAEPDHLSVTVVRSLDHVWEELGISSPKFESLE